MTQDERLLRLEISESARDVLSSYCRSLDTSDPGLLESILHPDVVLERAPDSPVVGREDVLKFFLVALEHKVESRRHFVTNPVVNVLSASTAQVSSYFFALHNDKGQLNFAWGDYQFDVECSDGRCLIKRLVIGLDMPIAPLSTMLGDS